MRDSVKYLRQSLKVSKKVHIQETEKTHNLCDRKRERREERESGVIFTTDKMNVRNTDRRRGNKK